MNEKKLGLGNVVSISVGLVVATSCLVSLGNGAGTLGVTFILAMAIAMLLNMTTVASLSELNALMPNTTGGLAQYTLAALGPFPTLISMVGGYIICNTMSCGVEASIFSFSLAEAGCTVELKNLDTNIATKIMDLPNREPSSLRAPRAALAELATAIPEPRPEIPVTRAAPR